MKILPVVKQLKTDEGFRQFPYRCTANRLTIGYGWNLEDRGITKQEAEKVLIDQVIGLYLELSELFPWFDELGDARKGVLVQMAYQMGVNGVLGFKEMLKALALEDYPRASDEMLNSKWAKADTPKRAGRLAAIMLGGEE